MAATLTTTRQDSRLYNSVGFLKGHDIEGESAEAGWKKSREDSKGSHMAVAAHRVLAVHLSYRGFWSKPNVVYGRSYDSDLVFLGHSRRTRVLSCSSKKSSKLF